MAKIKLEKIIITLQYLDIWEGYYENLLSKLGTEEKVYGFLRRHCENWHSWSILIDNSFSWRETPQGFSFWRDVSDNINILF